MENSCSNEGQLKIIKSAQDTSVKIQTFSTLRKIDPFIKFGTENLEKFKKETTKFNNWSIYLYKFYIATYKISVVVISQNLNISKAASF